jgi:hypothetical protein
MPLITIPLKMKKNLLLLVSFFISTALMAQTRCTLTGEKSEVTVQQLLQWSETPPLTALCGKEKLILTSFEFTVFTKKPLQTKTFGLGDRGGIPVMAHQALKELQPGATVILKDITALKPDNTEMKIENISAVIIE